ncbi:hypothetical protein M0L63_RS01540 [Providencia rettgeri]|nr:hypothetical protein [Providencia rettgeri]
MISTKSILKSDVFERFLMQSSSTINEVSLVVFGLPPFTAVKDIPEDMTPFVKEVRLYMKRCLNSLSGHYKNMSFHPSTECYMELILASAYRYINENTPEAIADKITSSVQYFVYSNKWEDYMRAFGGDELLNIVSEHRKTGRGAHRKEVEQNGTNKILGLTLKLLISKSNKYGSPEKPKISEIYADILKVVQAEEATMTGLAKATFYNKVNSALQAIHD